MLNKKVFGLIGIVAVAIVATIGVMKWLERSGDSHPATKPVTPSNQSDAETADWCAEHRVPESECTKCHPKLIEAFKAKNDWCAEHGLPESHCRQCNPSLTFPQELSAATNPIQLDMDAEISVFFPKNKTACATDGALVQFASAKTAERVGLTMEPAVPADMAPTVEAPAEVVFDETRTTAVTTTVPTLVLRWLASPGQPVEEGEILAEVESPEMANLKAEYLENQATHLVRERERKRNQDLREQDIVSVAEYETSLAGEQSARAQLTRSEGLLRAAGLSPEDLRAIQTEQSVTSHFPLRAPGQGVLVKRQAVLGELMPAGTSLALISDPNSFWVEVRVREQDLKRIKTGQKLEFSTDIHGKKRQTGRVIWAAQFLDPGTRTATVRAKMQMAGRELHPGEFGRALIYTQGDKSGVLVPVDAVQWEGCCNVVFVQEAPDRFRPRKVEIETADAGHFRVTSGLKPGEQVVVNGSYLLKTELKKGSIGAGCCAPEPTS